MVDIKRLNKQIDKLSFDVTQVDGRKQPKKLAAIRGQLKAMLALKESLKG